jgi:hypothetical protein
MIVQAVSENLVVHDIRFNVPRGVATTIPGNLACDSRDLGRLMSENKIIRLDTNPRLDNKVTTQPKVNPPEPQVVAPPIDTPEVIELRTQLQKTLADLKTSTLEIQKLRSDLESSRTECGQLLADVSKLRAEVAKLKEEDSKLTTILGKLDGLPVSVGVQTSAAEAPPEIKVEDEIELEPEMPVFISSSVLEPPKSSKKMTARESTFDSGRVNESVRALKELRKKKGG